MALRDTTQKPAFVYTNIYQLYKKAKDASPITSDTRVFRADELAEAGVKVSKFEPPKLTPVSEQNLEKFASRTPHSGAFEDLKSNINKLNDLHARLRFMLKELEDLVGKK